MNATTHSTLLDDIRTTVKHPDAVKGRTEDMEPGTAHTYLRYDVDCAVTVILMPEGHGEICDAQGVADWFICGPRDDAVEAVRRRHGLEGDSDG